MATGMGDRNLIAEIFAHSLGSKGQPCSFKHRQSIHIRAQRDNRAGATSPQDGDNPCLGHIFAHFKPE